jgi:hypothetical protein
MKKHTTATEKLYLTTSKMLILLSFSQTRQRIWRGASSTIQRAEIFDMNMATYLWSYNQMSRYSQAVTVGQKGTPVKILEQ